MVVVLVEVVDVVEDKNTANEEVGAERVRDGVREGYI